MQLQPPSPLAHLPAPLTFQHLDGRVHFQAVLFDHSPDDLPKVALPNHILKLDVFPLQNGVAEGLRLRLGPACQGQGPRIELQDGLFPLADGSG